MLAWLHVLGAQEPMAEKVLPLMVGGERDREDPGTGHSSQSHAAIDLLPPSRSHFLRFPELPKIPPAGNQVFNTQDFLENTISKPQYSTLGPPKVCVISQCKIHLFHLQESP
jgi:hypothetical protein